MKKILMTFTVLAALAASAPARADHHDVFVHGVQKLSADACAVELWIDEDNQDAFEAVDRVTVDGVLLASIGDTFAAAINDPSANNDTDDAILFASSSFETATGLTADVPFPDASCAAFDAGSEFSFVLDDVEFGGPNTVIDTLTASSSFGGSNTAMAKASETASPTFIDLDTDTVAVANNSGDTATLGPSGGGSSSGGCSLVR
ncbi:MAG TPA: hypothetical protein VFX30_08275 [bacterium]|nr:hypothetical protein [bacterium]